MNSNDPAAPFEFHLSAWGDRLAGGTGIEKLMDDLGRALAEPHGELSMLGGGNPALIPEVTALWRDRLQTMLADGSADRMLGVYDPPHGNPKFVQAITKVLGRHLERTVQPEQIAVTGGGQIAFFALFNLLAGRSSDDRQRHILLPIAPEYIGYADQGWHSHIFRACKPRIVESGPHSFRYEIDWEALEITPDTAAICLSRPTNPSGNLLPDDEIVRLARLAEQHGIPLIVDNAYGLPFPQILERPVRMVDGPNVINVFSLSKVGLPGVRNAVVLAPETMAKRVSSVIALTGLANPTVGQAIVTPFLENGALEELSKNVVAPFYRRKRELACQVFAAAASDIDYRLHEAGGAMFLWASFPGLRIPTQELYQRLKARGVLVVPGEPFFFGLSEADESWSHRHQCLRISFAMPEPVVQRGLEIIAEEVRHASRA